MWKQNNTEILVNNFLVCVNCFLAVNLKSHFYDMYAYIDIKNKFVTVE